MEPSTRPSRLAARVAPLALFGLLVACGPSGASSSTTASSPARTGSPSALPSATTQPQNVPDATRLTAHNCFGPAPATSARQLGRYFTVRASPAWSVIPPSELSETSLLELLAPNAYGFGPTLIQFDSEIGPVHTSYGPQGTAHSIAQQHADAIAQEWSPNAAAGKISDCRLGGEAGGRLRGLGLL